MLVQQYQKKLKRGQLTDNTIMLWDNECALPDALHLQRVAQVCCPSLRACWRMQPRALSHASP